MTAKKQPTDFSRVKCQQTRMVSGFFGVFVAVGRKSARSKGTAHKPPTDFAESAYRRKNAAHSNQ